MRLAIQITSRTEANGGAERTIWPYACTVSLATMVAMSKQYRYSDHLDTITALATHLALTPKKSRTAPGLATSLSLEPDEVKEALRGFPGVFRKSQTTTDAGEHYFTLHARYALRAAEDDDDDPAELVQLRSEHLETVLRFASQRAAQESAFDQLKSDQKNAKRAAVIAAVTALASFVATILVALIDNDFWIFG